MTKSFSLCLFNSPCILSDVQGTYTGSAEDYVDLNDRKLYLKVSVTKVEDPKFEKRFGGCQQLGYHYRQFSKRHL